MKKILLASLLGCGMLSASAQSTGEVRFGITAGMNVANITKLDADSRIGFNLGGRVEYGLTDYLYLGSGLLLSQKGCEENVGINLNEYGGKFKANPLYLQIPIHIGYHYYLNDNLSLFGETGPYLAFGIGGKQKMDYEEPEEEPIHIKYDFFDDKNGANRFDMGWGLRTGIEVNHFQIHLSYEYGFTKVWDSPSVKTNLYDKSCHNSNFTVGLSYFF